MSILYSTYWHKISRLEDVIAGLSSQNQVLSLKLQIACATNSRLVSDEEEEQEHDEGEEQEQEEEQEEEQGLQEETGAPISKWDIVTNQSHHLKYKNGNDQFKKILNQATGQGNYYGKPLGQKLYAHAAAITPQNTFKNLEMILALNQAALLVDSGIGISSIELEKTAKTVPSASTVKDFVIDAATNSAFQAWEEIVEDNCKSVLLCDKGAKKTANAHFVKILCWWSKLTRK
jgi:hypothetical protein